jgi:FtsP/CotA-like multicopper oxidase with cupredoxin domain
MGFDTGAVVHATVHGPVLVVHQGDAVSITLHNKFSQDVSPAVSGQNRPALNRSSGDNLSGVAPGAAGADAVTAGWPGTFLHEFQAYRKRGAPAGSMLIGCIV